MSNAKQTFLQTLDREFATTMRVLRAYPTDKLDLKPSEKSKTAHQLGWTFVLERGLGMRVWRDELAKGLAAGSKPPAAPESWDEILTALEKANGEYRALIAAASDEELHGIVHFFVAPKTMGELTRLHWIWFLLHDEIHHRGQFSVYVRMAGGTLPSIYGPTADEPWF